MFKIVCLLAMVMHVAFGGMFSVPSPLVVPSVQKMQQGRRDLSSIDVCTVDTCGFDGSSFEKIRRIRQSFDASDPEIVMYWSFVGEDKIRIGVDATNVNGWFSIGMSANGGMMGADLWRLMEDNGNLALSDMFVDDWVTPVLDTVQNVNLLTAQQTTSGRTSFSFERKLVTCDGGANRVNFEVGNQDFDIRSHEIGNIIYAWGNNHDSFSYHGTTRRGYAAGFSFGDSSNDFGGALVDEEGREGTDDGSSGSSDSSSEYNDTLTVNLINDAYTIDHTRSTILVHTHWTPPPGAWAILNVAQVSEPSLSRYHHHMLFYGCSEPVANHSDPLEERGEGVCNEILAVSPGFGLAVGDGSQIHSFRVEVHYDGLTPMTEDTLDPGAGYVITLAPNDGRVEEMGIMSTGTFGLAIPALKDRTHSENHFWGECVIPNDIPAEGVTVLYNFFHMHLKGRGMYVSHIRDGVELEPLGRQNYYDWWYQGTSGEPNEIGRKLLPGDRLITHCYYDTKNSESWHDRGGTPVSSTDDYFPFGEGTDEEMCFNFIAYYPRHPSLTSCFSTFGVGNPSDNFDDRRQRQLREDSSSSAVVLSKERALDIQRVLSSASSFSEILNGMKGATSGVQRMLQDEPAPACASSSGSALTSCFDERDSRCFSGLADACRGDASQCFASDQLCTAQGVITAWTYIIADGACLTAFAFCGPCYPHSPCGGNFNFELLTVQPYTQIDTTAPSSSVTCMNEEASSSSSSSSGMSAVVIGGAVAGCVALAVMVGIAVYMSKSSAATGGLFSYTRPSTPPTKSVVPGERPVTLVEN